MTVLGYATVAALTLLVMGMLLGFLRLALGPSLPDRVVALDLIGVTAVGFIAVVAVATDEPTLLEVATVQALIAFMGTVAFAYYVQRRQR